MGFQRRRLLQSGFISAIAATQGPGSLWGRATATNRIREENERPGTADWMLTKTQIDPATKYRSPWVEGYASHASIVAGQSLRLMVSTSKATSVSIQLFRLGYYAGLGGRLIKDLGWVPSKEQPTPEPGPRHLMDCRWDTTHELTIESDWTSGVYVAKLTESTAGLQSYILFVIRDERRSELVFQCSDHTWQAYNRWPSQYSLYDSGENEWYWGGESAVSFNRPYGKYCQILDQPLSIGSGEFFLWEFPFAYWLEQQGFDVTYISNTDLHRDADQAMRGKGFLSVGHDEYWTIEMYRHAERAIREGTSFGFFSGNAICGRVEWNESTRSFHRVGVFGPPTGIHEFQGMRHLMHERPYANELIGAHSIGPVTGGSDWICTQPEHWVYAGTGMKHGDRIPGVIGWEWHGDPASIPGLEVIATGPTQTKPEVFNGGTYTATVYPSPKGGVVFNASTCWWGDGLSQPPGYLRPSVYASPQGPNPWQQRMTLNVINKMLHR